MTKIIKAEKEKEAIIAEYLLGGTSFRNFGKKYGLSYSTICCWVQRFTGKKN